MSLFSDCLKSLPLLKGIHREALDPAFSFDQAAGAFASDPGTVLLMSGGDTDASRYHILSAAPWLELKCRQENITLHAQDRETVFTQDPFSVLQALLTHYHLDSPGSDVPVAAGVFGYFSYDLKDRIENLPITCQDTHLPDLVLYAPSVLCIHDKETKTTELLIPLLEDGDSEQTIARQRSFFLEKAGAGFSSQPFFVDSNGLTSSFSKAEYMTAVRKIIDYLNAGDIYQANLSQRFDARFDGDAYALFLDLYARNPAAFFSFINAGDHTIVSTSPERFIRQSDRYVETRPIKGTIARGRTEQEDIENSQTLVSSIKDDAELTMIVDLMRNDLSRVTAHESVEVCEHKRLEPYDNVFHLVSVVQGRLLPDKTSVDLLKATFPGGSITGCPKIRSMEIIDELESVKRHVYTGSIGYISFHDSMDLSIAIRTATIAHGRVFFSVGGGIVYDSDPEKEYQETLDKGRTLMESLSGGRVMPESRTMKAWVDGKMVDADKAMVSAASTGFQYGAGLFETIRVVNGVPCRLVDHQNRLARSWKSLFSQSCPDITWGDVISQLVRENSLEEKILAVKLIAARDEQANGKQLFLAAFAREYTHRLALLGKEGLDLVSYPYPRLTPLADQKTMNYLYYERAGQFAKTQHADEAIILNPDQTVSETNTANIMAVNNKAVIVPASDHVLEGVTQAAVLCALEKKGYQICEKRLTVREWSVFENVIVTNALMGAVKVLTIDGKRIKHENDICPMINTMLFNQENN